MFSCIYKCKITCMCLSWDSIWSVTVNYVGVQHFIEKSQEEAISHINAEFVEVHSSYREHM